MNPRHAQFVREFLVDLNATAAYRRVYPFCSAESARRNASRLLTHVDIQRELAVCRQRLIERTELTTDWIVRRLKTVAERSLQEEPVLDKQGHPTGEYQFDSSGANRSLELLGKHLGIFEPDLTEHKRRPIMVMNFLGPAAVQVGAPTRSTLDGAPRTATVPKRAMMALPPAFVHQEPSDE